MIYYLMYKNEYTDSDYATLYEKVRHYLPVFRQAKADKIRNNKGKLSSALVYLLLSYALFKEYNLINPSFINGNNDKPYLPDEFKGINKALSFNMSHSNRGVAVIIGNEELGIDMQDVRHITDAVKSTFNMSGCEDYEFCEEYSRYEAFVKYTSEGITKTYVECDMLSEPFLKNRQLIIDSYKITDVTTNKAAAYISAAHSINSNYSINEISLNTLIDFCSAFSK